MPPEKEGFQSEDNLEDTLNAAIDELGGWDDDIAPAPAAAAEPAEDADDDGPADPVLAPEPAEAKEPAKEAAEDEADDLPQAVEGDIDSPKHWPDALKARLAGIKDPDARKLMLDYNAHMNERWRQEKTVLNQQAQVGSAALEALAPHIEELRQWRADARAGNQQPCPRRGVPAGKAGRLPPVGRQVQRHRPAPPRERRHVDCRRRRHDRSGDQGIDEVGWRHPGRTERPEPARAADQPAADAAGQRGHAGKDGRREERGRIGAISVLP